METIKKLWLKLSLENRKRIVSFLNTFVVTFLTLIAAQMQIGFPESWSILGALILSVARTSIREAIQIAVNTYK